MIAPAGPVDRTTLPTALLATAKSHMRVEHARDDAYISGCLARVMDLFERTAEYLVFARQAAWTPTELDQAAGGVGWVIPLFPATSHTVMEGAADVSTGYVISGATPSSWGVQFFSLKGGGLPAADATREITLGLGFKTSAELPPGVLDVILRGSAWLYENREAALMPGVDAPAYMNSLLSGYWAPRC